jgi:hypothetical protein
MASGQEDGLVRVNTGLVLVWFSFNQNLPKNLTSTYLET